MLTRTKPKLLLFVWSALALLAVAACSGGNDSNPSGTSTPSAQTTSRTPTPGVTATSAAAVTGTPTVQEGGAAALAAALQTTGGVTGADCAAMPDKACVTPDSTYSSSVERGMAIFNVGAAANGPGYHLVLGKDQAGQWQYWLGTQQDLEPFTLPGDMRVCSGGTGLNVRSTPATDGPIVQTLADGTLARGEEFLLTQPGGTLQSPGPVGHGWYRISAPVAGWVSSDFVYHGAPSIIPDCAGLPLHT